jgi:hypothetical protein
LLPLVKVAKIKLLQEYSNIIAFSVIAKVIILFIRVVPKSCCNIRKTLIATLAKLKEEDKVYVKKDNRNIKEDNIIRVNSIVIKEIFV